jgi:hypothetical protein
MGARSNDFRVRRQSPDAKTMAGATDRAGKAAVAILAAHRILNLLLPPVPAPGVRPARTSGVFLEEKCAEFIPLRLATAKALGRIQTGPAFQS